jgi:hypothetical protein
MDDLMDCMPDEFGYFKGEKKQVPILRACRSASKCSSPRACCVWACFVPSANTKNALVVGQHSGMGLSWSS